MRSRLQSLIAPKSRLDVARLTIAFSAISVALSVAGALAIALARDWVLPDTLVTAAILPLFIAPWMLWMVGTSALRLHEVRQELERLARVDPLTGALNRRGMREFLDGAGACLCVILVDLDEFKTINDRYGHAAGDETLAQVADAMRRALATFDAQIMRIGGDELGALLTNATLTQATVAAERLRRQIAATPVASGGRLIRVTASLGVAERLPGDLTPEAAINRADAALYMAKTHGRNAVRAA